MKLTLQDISSGYQATAIVNANNDLVEAAVENTLSRDGTSPNDMQANLDMGGYRVINLGEPINQNDAVRLQDLADVVAGGDVVISPVTSWSDLTDVPATVDNIADLVDPNADRLVFWDDSAGALVYLTLGTGLSIAGTTISSTASSVAWSGITSVPAYVTSLGALVDPNADRLLFWDDSASNIGQATVSTGLSLSGTTLTVSILGLQNLTDPGADRIFFWDDSANQSAFLSLGTGLSITGTTLNASATALTADGANITLPGNVITFASQTSSPTVTLTGVSGSVTGSAKYSKNGNVVVLQLPDLSGTSNSTAHTITGLPTAIRPASVQTIVGITENNGTDALGLLLVQTDGSIVLYNGFSATFAGTSTEGCPAQTISYHLS